MYHRIPILLGFALFAIIAKAQTPTPLIVNTYNRPAISLNGAWHYIVDPYENGYYNYRYEPFDQQANPGNGAFFTNAKPRSKSDLIEYDFDKADTIRVPGDWNSQKEKLFYYEGTVWYKTAFDYQVSKPDNRVFVYFGAANYRADVYLNGHKLGYHEGGFTPFNFEITSLLKEKDNFLIVKVDNKRLKDAVPTLNTDWWNYGGLTRDVEIVEVPATFIRDYKVQLDPANPTQVKGFVQLDGSNAAMQRVQIQIPELKIDQTLTTDKAGFARLQFPIGKIQLWTLENPKLYQVTLKTTADAVTDPIGFRTIKTQGADILLNGKSVFLRGISIHEENALRGGRAYSRKDAELLLGWARELGCNFVRLAHYPHNENMVRLADEMGMLVWEENPVYWTISWDNPDTYANAANQLTEVITRDKNRASVIIWSMANETPVKSERTQFLGRLATVARGLDNTRLLSAAMEQHTLTADRLTRTLEDPFSKFVDVLSFNQYIGWYDGVPSKCDSIIWKITEDKPVIISEFGGGAKYGNHGDKLARWTEEYQEDLYIRTIAMLKKIPQLRGMTPWVMVDFRSPRRPLTDIQDGWNRKGLISDKGEKKKAFFVLQQYYQSLAR